MSIELRRASQPEITEYPEAELEIVRREIALEQTGVDPKLAIEHMLIAKFGLDYRYEDLTDTQRNVIRDTTLEAFSRHIENPNHSIYDDTLRSQVLLLWAKVGNQDVYAVADMFSIEDTEIDTHALGGLRHICSELPNIPERRFKSIAPILAGIHMQTLETLVVDASSAEPEEPASQQEPLPEKSEATSIGNVAVAQETHTPTLSESDNSASAADRTAPKSNYKKYFTVPGVSPDVSRRRPVKNYTEDVVPLTPQQLESTDYEKLLFKKVINQRILSREEMTELSKDIEAGLVAQHKLEHMPDPGSDSTVHLYEELQALSAIGHEAKDKLVRHNLRLVMRIATPYQRRAKHLDFTDLFTEGALGLIHAVEKFDYKKGFSLTTYATPWIHQAIRRSIQKTDRVVYLPENIQTNWHKIDAAAAKYEEEFGAKANDAELAAYMDMPLGTFTLTKQAMPRAVSLNTPMGEKGDEEFGDLLYDKSEKTTDDVALEITLPAGEALYDAIAKHVSGNPQKTEAVQALFLYCGIPSTLYSTERGKAYSVEAISKMLDVSRYVIQSRITHAQAILAEPHIMNLLRDLATD
jgi:RNA polymerase primary sigma factor